MTGQKKRILKIMAGVLLFLVLMTLISQNVNQMLMPKVEVVSVGETNVIEKKAECTGTVVYSVEKQFLAQADYRIQKVCVTAGQKIGKGDVLFEIESFAEDDRWQELELSALAAENQIALQRLRMETELSRLEKEIALAQTDLDKQSIAKEEALRLKELQQVWFQAKNQLNKEGLTETERAEAEVAVRVAETELNEYMRLQELDDGEARLQLMLLEKENQRKVEEANGKATLQELQKKLEIIRVQQEHYRENYPEDGKILSPYEGVIQTLFLDENKEEISAGTPLFTYTEKENLLEAVWTMSYEAGLLYQNVQKAQLIYQAVDNHFVKEISLEAPITGCQLEKDTNSWRFTAQVSELAVNTPIRVILREEPKYYDYVLPLSCIAPGSSGGYCIRTVESRRGLFSEEQYVKELPAEILDKNHFYAAVSSPELTADTRVIRYTNRELRDGDSVEVVNE